MLSFCYHAVMAVKIRTQIQLDPSDYEALKEFARSKGLSISAAVRLLLREKLQPSEPANWDSLFAFAGSCTDLPDVSVNHNEYLYGDRR